MLQTNAKDFESLESLNRSLNLANDENSIRILNNRGEILKTIEYNHEWPARYYFSPDGNLIFISFVDVNAPSDRASKTNSVGQIWDVSDPENIRLLSSINLNFNAYLYDPMPVYIQMQFSEDNRELIICLDRDQVAFYNTSSGILLSAIPGNSDCRLYKNNTQILTQDSSGNINIWDIKNFQSPRLIWQQNSNNADTAGLQYGMDQQELIFNNNGMFSTSLLSDSQAENKKRTYFIPRASTTTVSPNGRWLAYMNGSDIFVMDREQDEGNWRSIFIPQAKPFVGFSNSLVFSPDSQQIAASMNDQRIWIKNLITGKESLISNERYISQLIFSPDGKALLSLTYDDGQIWNIETGKLIGSISESGTLQAFHPNGKFIIAINQDENLLRLISFPSGTVIKQLNIPAHVDKAVLAPDGIILALLTLDSTEFLNLETGEILARIDKRVLYLDFSADRKSMVTYLWGGQILTWKVGK